MLLQSPARSGLHLRSLLRARGFNSYLSPSASAAASAAEEDDRKIAASMIGVWAMCLWEQIGARESQSDRAGSRARNSPGKFTPSSIKNN
ncbi:hypothetical protein E2562_017147 [Oryza meyeriana var. granulata]|uniref:Uncharacterized protein n=1 Tax=Oryza meyeriana var. granulata TaxID=110450 RepID=A0A6G1ELN5_9ORYZ|nr:hypothetical protein E2562_017147 [Oryza meyeriana var. granulata]